MLHVTLNTGHSRRSPRSEVGDDVIAILSPLLVAGTHKLPQPRGYQLRVTIADDVLMATVFADVQRRPCVTFAVAPTAESADDAWQAIEAHYHAITELPGIRSADFAAAVKPESAPWCAAVTILATPEEAAWIADLERCMAWAWIEAQ